jgi:hypothetical protein
VPEPKRNQPFDAVSRNAWIKWFKDNQKNINSISNPTPLLMHPGKIFIIVLFMITAQSCGEKPSNSGSNSVTPAEATSVSTITLLTSFPIENLKELSAPVTSAEFKTLTESGESQHWTLQKHSENSFTITNKEYEDNAVKFLAIHPASGLPMLVVQQINAQVIVTQGWRYTPADEQWFELGLPVLTAKQFAAENVSVPDGYDDMTPYLNVSIEGEKIISSVNQWIFSKELENEYLATGASALDSYFKYYYEITWNGEEFTIDKQIEKDYTEIFNVAAQEQTEDPDGPGITEFDCHDGYQVAASSELKPSSSVNYGVNNILRDDDVVWSEGKAGDGVNEWIEFSLTGDFLIGNSYQLRNGYVKSASLWKANNRVKKFDVVLNDKTIATVTLLDIQGYQSFNIIPPFIKDLDVKKGDKIKFVIREIYKGEKYDDTVISYFVTQGNCG